MVATSHPGSCGACPGSWTIRRCRVSSRASRSATRRPTSPDASVFPISPFTLRFRGSSPREASQRGRAEASLSRLGARLLVVELVLVPLAGPGLGAEAALESRRPHAGRWAARLGVADASALNGPFPVAARLDALGLALLLWEMRRPGGVSETTLLVAPGELEQLLERAGLLIDVAGRIAERTDATGHGVEAQVARLGLGHLVPAQGARHASVRRRAHGVAGRDSAVAGVLVVIHEHAMALLLPPLARGEVGRAALDLARQRERGATHPEEVPVRLDAHVHVDALGPGGLRVAAQPVLGEHLAHDHRGAAHGIPPDAGRRVEVDAQLVGMVQIASPRGPRVEVDDAEVDRPDQVCGIVGHQLLRSAP